MATTTSRRYEPGDLIYESKPYIKVIRRDLWETSCAWCLKRDVELKRCSRCKMARYCGMTCQGKNWKSITDEVMGQKVSLDDLKFQNFQLMRKPWFRLYLKVTEIALKSYLGEENVPNEETLLMLIGKVDCNYYSFGEEKSEIWALFIGASKFDHSCVPNANVHFNGKDIQIKAIKKIDKFEKVTFSYCRMFSLFDVSSEHLNMKNSFGERGCCCNDCSQPYGLSPLTKILDPARAICILEETEGHLLMASLMAKFNYPMQWFSQERLKQLLKKQEGILGDTNLARIRLLSLKCLLLKGNNLEMREELMTLASWVKRVWGENYEELTDIYKKLIEINAELNDEESCEHYINELFRLKMICVGEEDAMKEACKNFFFPI